MQSAIRPTPDELEAYEGFAVETVRAAGALILPYFRQGIRVEDKTPGDDGFDPVTEADRAAEAAIRRAIVETWPDHGILGEEGGFDGAGADLTWVIDPIDGTRGFISGFVQWGTLLALSVRGRPVLGVVHQPWTGETWVGSERGTRFLRGATDEIVRVRACEGLDSAILATTDPDLFIGYEAEAFRRVREHARLTRYGADCYAYCMLAMGQLDLVVESGLKPWDVQAIIAVVEGAGGRVTDWRGRDAWDGGQVIASADERVHADAIEQLAPFDHA